MNPAVFANEHSFLTTFLASFLIWFMLGGVAILWIIDGKVKREQAIHASFSAVLAYIITIMVKGLFPAVRPYDLYGILPLTITLPNPEASFPSTHSAVAFAIAVSIYMHNKVLGKRFLVLAALVALGRVLSSAHFPHDVAAGILIGIATSYVIKKSHLYKLV